VLGALRLAKQLGAATIGVTANRRSAVARLASVVIAPDTGPEIIAGSTRMKAGTAQKMVLHTLSTAAWTRLGRVYDNWMVDVAPANRKLRERGLRILQEASGTKERQASLALARANGEMRVALVMLKRGVPAKEARRRLRQADGDLRRALGEASNKKAATSAKNARMSAGAGESGLETRATKKTGRKKHA
jgi:N-acetylmuramic acid 6-phosphate etherase